MRTPNEKLKADILEAARQEFLTHGYLGAQLREIADKAGATTGSIYKYYKGKEDLFDALVAEPAAKLEQRYLDAQQEFASLPLNLQLETLPEIPETQFWMVDYLYDHFDAFKLITCCSTGTKYAGYIERLIKIEVESSRKLIDLMTKAGMKIHQIDDELSHIVASALFYGMFETVRHDMPRKKAYDYMISLKDFYSAGWFKILGVSSHENIP